MFRNEARMQAFLEMLENTRFHHAGRNARADWDSVEAEIS
jgi:hypothetical protein